MASLKEYVDGLTDTQRTELIAALGIKPSSSDGDILKTLQLHQTRLDALESKGAPPAPAKPKAKTAAWWENLFDLGGSE
jgi:hypothetical protein